MARKTRSNIPLPPGLKATDIKPAATGAAGYTEQQRQQAREYLDAKRREGAAKKSAQGEKEKKEQNQLPPEVAQAQAGVMSTDPDFLRQNPNYFATSGGVDVAGQKTGNERVVGPQIPATISFTNLSNMIKGGQLMNATDQINQIGYLALARGGGVEPTGIIEEQFIVPSASGFGYTLVDKNELISSRLSNLSLSQIKALKVDFYRKGLYSSNAAADLSLRAGSMLDEDFRQVYQNYARQASLENFARATRGNSDLLTPEDFIGAISDIPLTQTETQVSIPGAEDTDAVLRQRYEEYVGRAPNKKELDAFRASVTSVARTRPTVTTVTRGEATPGLGIGGISGYRQSGFTENTLREMARTAARENPESAPYQQATKYFDTFLSSLPAARGLEASGVNLEELLASGGVG